MAFNSNQIRCNYVNIRSLLARSEYGIPRFELLESYCVMDNEFDVIILTGTHIDETVGDAEIYLEGYSLFRKDRTINGRRGGGVCIYCKNELNPLLINFDSS